MRAIAHRQRSVRNRDQSALNLPPAGKRGERLLVDSAGWVRTSPRGWNENGGERGRQGARRVSERPFFDF